MKSHKIDLRLTEEQNEWITREAKAATVGKSTFVRQLLEKMRKEEEAFSICEGAVPYNQNPTAPPKKKAEKRA